MRHGSRYYLTQAFMRCLVSAWSHFVYTLICVDPPQAAKLRFPCVCSRKKARDAKEYWAHSVVFSYAIAMKKLKLA